MNHVAKGDNLSPEATKAFKRMNELQLQTISMSFQYEDIPEDFVQDYKNMEVTSIEALKLTQDSVIASKNLSDLKFSSLKPFMSTSLCLSFVDSPAFTFGI